MRPLTPCNPEGPGCGAVRGAGAGFLPVFPFRGAGDWGPRSSRLSCVPPLGQRRRTGCEACDAPTSLVCLLWWGRSAGRARTRGGQSVCFVTAGLAVCWCRRRAARCCGVPLTTISFACVLHFLLGVLGRVYPFAVLHRCLRIPALGHVNPTPAASAQPAAPPHPQQEAAQPQQQRAQQERKRGCRGGRRVQSRRRAAQQASACAPAQDSITAVLSTVQRITADALRVAAGLAGRQGAGAAAAKSRGAPRRAAPRRPAGSAPCAAPAPAAEGAAREDEAHQGVKRHPSESAESVASSDTGMSCTQPHDGAALQASQS
jgi:hypothetical protein